MKNYVLIGLRIVLGLAFAVAGVMKLTGQPMLVTEFDVVGLGQWFRYVTGIIEIAGALLLIRSATVFYGAAVLSCVAIGAFFAQVLRLHGDFVHTLVFLALLAWVTFENRARSAPSR